MALASAALTTKSSGDWAGRLICARFSALWNFLPKHVIHWELLRRVHKEVTAQTVKAQKFTLLIVDDDDNQRLFVQKAFEALGSNYRIQAVPSGNEALAYLKGERQYSDRRKFEFPSYIITDLQMPDGDGFEILNFLKNNPALSVIPVVMFSSSGDADDIRQAYLLGASSYMEKPSGQTALQALVRKIHDYWSECEVPEVDGSGYAIETSSKGKAGERFPRPRRTTRDES